MPQTYIQRAWSAARTMFTVLMFGCLLAGCDIEYKEISNQLELLKRKNNIKLWIMKKNPEINENRAFKLAHFYIRAANKYNIDVSYIVCLGKIESHYRENQSYLGNFGVQQINWAAWRKELNKRYGITSKHEIMIDDEKNIEFAAYLIKDACTDPKGLRCNTRVLTREYNGKYNPPYQRKLERLLKEFKYKYS